MIVRIKTKIKKTLIFPYLVRLRTFFRVFYSTKSRSRFFWNLRSGDIKLSLDYPLTNDSVALVVGAFEGDYLNKLTARVFISVFVKGQNPNVYKWPDAESNCRPLVFQGKTIKA